MAPFNEDLKVIVEKLKQQRDVLALKIHLASADVRDEWAQLEKKWQEISEKSDQVMDEVDETSLDVQKHLHKLATDLKEHYTEIKKILD